MTKITQTFYIATGAKNAMYTLRCNRMMSGLNPDFAPDHYIRNLSTDIDKAAEKAAEYFEAFKQRVGENENFVLVLDTNPTDEIYSRRGKLSVQDTKMIESIEAGIVPFGKHAGSLFIDLPESYILFFADKFGETTRPVMNAFSAMCLGIAFENGYIAKRDERREEQRKKDLLSKHIGSEGERRVFEGTLESVFLKDSFDNSYYINKIRCGDDIVIYFGNKLGERGDAIKVKGTIKRHNERDGVLSTQINRPMIIN